MRRHIDTLGWAFTFYGFWILGLLAFSGVVTMGATLLVGAPWFVPVVSLVVLGLSGLFSAPFFLVGEGLRRRMPAARVAAIVLSILVITDLPVGLLLGLLGVGTLFDEGVVGEFRGELPRLTPPGQLKIPGRQRVRRPTQVLA